MSKCCVCLFWHVRDESLGLCRRHAPQLSLAVMAVKTLEAERHIIGDDDIAPLSTFWPVTCEDDLCGDYVWNQRDFDGKAT